MLNNLASYLQQPPFHCDFLICSCAHPWGLKHEKVSVHFALFSSIIDLCHIMKELKDRNESLAKAASLIWFQNSYQGKFLTDLAPKDPSLDL